MTDRVLVVEEVAEQLRVSPEAVRRWLRLGKIRGSRMSRRTGWRVRQSEVDRLLEPIAREDIRATA